MDESQPPASTSTISKGLLMAPTTAGYSNLLQHKRAGSTGTGTGDESYTTDEEDNNLDHDEPDCSIKEHVTSKLYSNSFGSFSDIATITDKVGHLTVMHRNSSDSSVYSDLGLDKCEDIDFKDLSKEDNGNGKPLEEWSRSVAEVKEAAFTRLQNELKQAHQELKLKDEEVGRLSRIRQEVETELEDLTASLFQEAHNMVRDANVKQAAAEKALHESQMKVDVLTAEVSALKTLVLTSTPSKPNPHLHPQIDLRSRGTEEGKKHRRCPSHFNLKYGRENSPPESPTKDNSILAALEAAQDVACKEGQEVDPVVQDEFMKWKELLNPVLNKQDAFIKRIYEEEINPCLRFTNRELTEKVIVAVEAGTICVEAIGDKTKTMFPKKCALLEVPRQCFYRMNIGEPDVWYSISKICRNRIIAVCDFLNYLRYIERGLVKSSAHEIYWEIARLRREMVFAKLGLTMTS
ncbi:guanine nucleotide exchange factor for Rab-3A-like [Atheta coriaria]|uniref:guanine nucleotide exchange factor for Rab-3A-like n=1 Tax=Dalotia coriaria TaxID=877792 RepID=UPI0031F447EC